MKNFCEDLFFFFFFFGDRLKNFCEDLFFCRALALVSLVLGLGIPVLGLESVCPRKGCPWPRIFFVFLALASSLVSSTPPLLYILLRVIGSSLEPSRPYWRRSHFRRATSRAEGIDSVSFLEIVSLV